MNHKCGMKEKWIGSAVLLAPFIVLCVQFIDVPVAIFVKNHLYSNVRWSRLTSELPDLLLLVVVVTTGIGLSQYWVRSRKGIYDAATTFDKLIAWAAPISYVVKDLLKSVFGRVNTRFWLHDPAVYRFDWFDRRPGFEGFPSGHMLVIVTILAAFWRFYPRTRPFCVALGALLAAALIVTNYHFLSDVVAGTYLGIAVEAMVFRMLLKDGRTVGSSTIS